MMYDASVHVEFDFLDSGWQTIEPPITDSTDTYIRQYYDKSVC